MLCPFRKTRRIKCVFSHGIRRMITANNKTILALCIIAIGLIGRLIPHLPNATAVISLGLFAGWRFKAWYAVGLMVAIMLVTDIVLGLTSNYPLFGSWSLFTYSGIILIALFGNKLQFNWQRLAAFGLSGCLFYWSWTNFGVFLLSALYPHTFAGLLACFIAAIPFLGHSLLANTIWLPVLFGSYLYLASSRFFAASYS